MMISDHYFAYGSNMNPARMRDRVSEPCTAASGTLRDYLLRFNKRATGKHSGTAYANVIYRRGAVTEGVVYRLSAPEQITKLDPHEVYPEHYDRLVVQVETTDGLLDAWVYIANADFISEGLKPARWYLEHLLAGKDYLSQDYYERLQGTEYMADQAELRGNTVGDGNNPHRLGTVGDGNNPHRLG